MPIAISLSDRLPAVSAATCTRERVGHLARHTRGVSPAATLVEALEPIRSDPARAAVLLDIDGTLAPIVRHAADAHVPEATRTLLIEIAKRYRIVGCVSGRRAATARQIVAIGTIAYVGNHGGELLRPGATRPEVDPDVAAWTARVRAFAARVYTGEHQRVRVRSEDKDAIAAFHWRGAPDEEAAAAAVQEIARLAEDEGFAIHWGRKVLEVRPPVALDKGLGIGSAAARSARFGRAVRRRRHHRPRCLPRTARARRSPRRCRARCAWRSALRRRPRSWRARPI